MVNRNGTSEELSKSVKGSLLLFSIDDCLCSDPAAGNRNGTSTNNVGTNGNYWSGSPNESNTQNAYNLNFNDDNRNVNWNNRNNGQSVRPVSELTSKSEDIVRHFSITKEQLLYDLYRAYKDARRNKRWKQYQLEFELNLEEELVRLRDEIMENRYIPRPSTCFVIHDPKMREIFAADFRDRIVHHLFYNYTHVLFERCFIHDSYSCIKNRGTHWGINRLKHHILSVSKGYTQPCSVLKIDIRGYFMGINRNKLFQLCLDILEKMRKHHSDIAGKTWEEVLDYNWVKYLLEIIIVSDPIKNCKILGNVKDWKNLPDEKSLFCAESNCGLPIGNLSSQLFSNIYLNILDQYVKRVLKCRHYGRYVDDAYVVSSDKRRLIAIIPKISRFLELELGLKINREKTKIVDVNHGVEFLGAYIKPFRTYISSSSKQRIETKLKYIHTLESNRMCSSINSYLGIFSHYKSYCLRRVLFGNNYWLNLYGHFTKDWLTYRLYNC